MKVFKFSILYIMGIFIEGLYCFVGNCIYFEFKYEW